MILEYPDRIEAIQRAVGLTGRDVDGITGPTTQKSTWDFLDHASAEALESVFEIYGLTPPAKPTNQLLTLLWGDLKGNAPAFRYSDTLLNREGIRQILEFEGVDQPWLVPPGRSGITIGYGYDLQFYSWTQFQNDWGLYLAVGHMQALKTALGKNHEQALAIASKLRAVEITKTAAEQVFLWHSLPYWYKKTSRVYFGFHLLQPDAQTALVSLVFNRGDDLTDEPGSNRRREMRNIAKFVIPKDYDAIAQQIRLMKRLWINSDAPGLVKRREREARLVESCVA